MLQNILNLDGVTVLNKKQQNSVNGGQVCVFTVTMNGSTRKFARPNFPSGNAASSAANSACVSVIENTDASSCHYDCEYDGLSNSNHAFLMQ